MDGKNGWFIKYCDKLAADLSKLCEEHFKGLANRHTADDVDYDEEMTVKEKIDYEVEQRKGLDNTLSFAIQAEVNKRISEDDKIKESVSDEISAREAADTALGGRIDSEALARQNADTALENKIDAEIERSKGLDGLINFALDAETTKRSEEDKKLQQQIDSIKTKGTWADPFLVSDPNADLSTLTTPGIYYFDFDEFKEISHCGCYNRGYMEVAEVWGDNISRKIISQKICTGFEGKVFYFVRTVDTNRVGNMDNDTDWRQFETTSGTVGGTTLEKRIEDLEERIKGLVDSAINSGDLAKLKDDVTALGKRIDDEASERKNADETLQENIVAESEDLNNRIDEEAIDRRDADTALESKIDTEIERSKGLDSLTNFALEAETTKRSELEERVGLLEEKIKALDDGAAGDESELADLKNDVAKLKQSAVASVSAIGTGLKLEDNTLSVDCATADETSGAVKSGLK